MSDFRVQYISGSIASGQTQKILTAPADFLAVGSLASAFTLPATNYPTVGIGVSSAASQLRDWTINCGLIGVDEIHLNRANDGSAADYAFWIIEYIGTPGGSNEFIMRGRRVFAFAAGATTQDSAAIDDIVNINDCVPFISGRHIDNSTSSLRHFLAEAQIVNDGTDNVIRLTRKETANGEPTYVAYCVEFTGSNWTIATGSATNYAANTNKDTTIASVTLNKAWLHTYFIPSNRDTPAGGTYYAWLTSSTNLRSRAIEAGSTSTLRYYIIQNADANFSVGRTSAVDGVDDWTAGSSPQAQSITTSVTPENGTFVIGHAGSSATTTADNPAGVWRFRRISSTEVEALRTRSIGGSEYVLQTISLPADTATSFNVTPTTSVLLLSGKTVNGDLVLTPGVAALQLIPFGPFSEAFRSPLTASLTLNGGSVIVIAVNPAQSALALQGRAPTLQTLKVISPAVPDLDYTDVNSTAPTIILGTALQPATAALTIQALEHSATEGGNIGFRSPATAVLTMTGQGAAIAIINNTPAALTVSGLAPSIGNTHALLEPGVGALVMVQTEASTDFVHIPFQWLDYDPAPVVAWG